MVLKLFFTRLIYQNSHIKKLLSKAFNKFNQNSEIRTVLMSAILKYLYLSSYYLSDLQKKIICSRKIEVKDGNIYN